MKMGAKSAPTQIRAEKVWWQKVPLLFKSGGTSATLPIIVVVH